MSVNCYPQPNKQKARLICEAFARGCGGSVVDDGRLRPGPAMFYGIAPGMEPLWRGVQDGRDWFLADNSYFDTSREKYFRVTKNRLQHSGFGTSDGKRFAALGIAIKPWRTGKHIVVCPQSDHFMANVAGYSGNWTADTLAMLQTQRSIRVRPWARDKTAQAATLQSDLDDAHALVTWSSAAAVTAIISGVPVVCAAQSAAWRMSATFPEIESPPKPERENWCGVLADNQWTIDELASGAAWATLQ